MAALGRLVARARIARQPNVASAAAKAWEGSNVTHPACCRDKFSEYSRGYATKPRDLFGFLGKDGIFQGRDQRAAPPDYYGVDTRERDEESDEESDEEPRLREKNRQLLSVLPEEVKDPSKAKAVTETALDKGATVATSALDNVGSILSKTGLEFELDVSLQELSIEKLVLKDLGLVLKDLGLVLVIKTKPQPQPGPLPEPEPQPQAQQ